MEPKVYSIWHQHVRVGYVVTFGDEKQARQMAAYALSIKWGQKITARGVKANHEAWNTKANILPYVNVSLCSILAEDTKCPKCGSNLDPDCKCINVDCENYA